MVPIIANGKQIAWQITIFCLVGCFFLASTTFAVRQSPQMRTIFWIIRPLRSIFWLVLVDIDLTVLQELSKERGKDRIPISGHTINKLKFSLKMYSKEVHCLQALTIAATPAYYTKQVTENNMRKKFKNHQQQ